LKQTSAPFNAIAVTGFLETGPIDGRFLAGQRVLVHFIVLFTHQHASTMPTSSCKGTTTLIAVQLGVLFAVFKLYLIALTAGVWCGQKAGNNGSDTAQVFPLTWVEPETAR
jgi:hypothetical protein